MCNINNWHILSTIQRALYTCTSNLCQSPGVTDTPQSMFAPFWRARRPDQGACTSLPVPLTQPAPKRKGQPCKANTEAWEGQQEVWCGGMGKGQNGWRKGRQQAGRWRQDLVLGLDPTLSQTWVVPMWVLGVAMPIAVPSSPIGATAHYPGKGDFFLSFPQVVQQQLQAQGWIRGRHISLPLPE